ncbi:MAG: hypothetical protein J0M34_00670 [Alphaproteobacteria bacterium]|nr:hypothetical protein [Alphaproteobacteria bacterium]
MVRASVVAGVFFYGAAAYAADVASLPNNAPLMPDAPLAIDIHTHVSDERLNNLFIELNGADITPEVSLDGRRVSYRPESRLPIGDHIVRIFEHVGDEHYNEVQRFVVRVRGNGAKDAQVWGTASAQYNYLLHDDLEPKYTGITGVDPHSGSGYLESNAVAGGQNWDASMRLTGNYDTNEQLNLDKERGQLGEYLLTGRTFTEDMTATLRLGNHNTGISNLLIDQFNRRGGSLQIDALKSLKLTAFSQDPAYAIGDNNLTGVQDGNQRVSGFHAQYYPLGEETHFFVESAYTYGQGREYGGYGDALFDATQSKGRGWMVGSEWQGLKDQLNLRGEFANTDFDYDGEANDLSAINDDAVRGRSIIALIGDLDPRTFDAMGWSLTLDRQKVGSFFHSMANSNYAADQDRYGVTSNFFHESLSITGDLSTSDNNVNSISTIPTDRSNSASVQLSVSPEYFGSAWEKNDWFTYSSFNAGAYSTQQDRKQTPATFNGLDMQQHISGGNAGWSTAFGEELTLNLSHSYSKFTDDVTTDNDQDSGLSELAITYTPNERFSMTPSLQHERQHFKTLGDRSNYFAAVDMNYILIPDTLTNHSYGSVQLNDSGDEDRQYNASTELYWNIRQADKNHIGYGISWSANYQRVEESANTFRFDAGEQFTTYVSFKINAPYGW